MLSVIVSASLGYYPDGYVPEGKGLFILVDQIWLLMLCMWHTIEYTLVLLYRKPTSFYS
jgi:hypothetical protein